MSVFTGFLKINPLFTLAEIRIFCKKLKISEMIEKHNKIEVKFTRFSDININKLMQLINKYNGNIYLMGKFPNSIFIKSKDFELLKDKGEYISEILNKM